MIGRLGPRQQGLDGGQKIVGDGAANAAVGELDDVVLAAGVVTARREHLAVDTDVAELVDHQRQAPAVGVFDKVADQAGLAGAEKAGHHGGGNFFRGVVGF